MKKLIILTICLFLCACSKVEPVFKNVIIEPNVIDSSKLTLSMVGDALIHEPIYKDAYKSGRYDFSSIFTEFKEKIKDRDLLYYNQESIIGGDNLKYSSYPSFNTPSSFGEEMVNMGFNIVSRANNHALDKGEIGLLNSCNFWNEHPYVLTNGSACTKEEQENIRIMEKNGIRYALLSYTTLTNGLEQKEDYYLSVYTDKRVEEDIAKIRGDADLILVAMHWGEEYKHMPTEIQKQIAHHLASLGVNIVIGTHPHVIEPIEWIDNTLVIYSLGNFIASQSTIDEYARRIGLMVNCDIIKTTINDKASISIKNLNVDLVYTFSNGLKNYKLYTFDKIDNSILSNYKIYKTKYSSIIKSYDNNIIIN